MKVLHGTSRIAWEKTYEGETSLYVTIHREDAENYAFGCAASDEENGMEPTPILVTLNMDTLSADFVLMPDEATVETFGLPENATWRDTLDASGSFVISGPINTLKSTADIENLLRDD